MLKEVAKLNGFKVKNIKVKNLKSRWGSCDSEGNIALSTSLIRLDAASIHYVICHELVHTRHMNHGKKFWEDVEALVPDYKTIRKNLSVMHTLP